MECAVTPCVMKPKQMITCFTTFRAIVQSPHVFGVTEILLQGPFFLCSKHQLPSVMLARSLHIPDANKGTLRRRRWFYGDRACEVGGRVQELARVQEFWFGRSS